MMPVLKSVPLLKSALAATSQLGLAALLLVGATAPMIPVAIASEVQVAQAQPQQRLRVAVLDFDFASTGQTWTWWGGVAPAQGVSTLLTNKLVDGGAYTLIERSRIDAVLAEQNLAQAGRIDPSTAAQIGRLLGADVMVLGAVTRYNLEEGRSGGSFLGFGGNSGRTGAEVQLTARLVNTTTGEILATADGSGKATQGSGGISIGGIGSFGADHSNNDELLSKAAEDAVTQLASQLTAKASTLAALPPSLPTVQALVADVAGGEITINKGSQEGFRDGMTLSIERVTREVKDPATGEVIRVVTSPVGRIELTQVDGRSAVGRVVTGTGFKVGDRAIAVQ